MKIGIDIDEVVVEFVRGYLKLFADETNKFHKHEDIYSYNLWEPLNITKEESIKLAERYSLSEYFKNMDLVPGAKESLNLLRKSNELIFITSRPTKLKKQTEDFFDKHFKNHNFDIIFSSDFHKDQGKTKAQICKELGISLLIEDNVFYASDAASNGINVLLFEKPWNKQHKTPENVKRVVNWGEVVEHINSLKEKKHEY